VNRRALARIKWRLPCKSHVMIHALAKGSLLFLACAGLAAAEMYTGILVDAHCPTAEKGAPKCDPTPATKSFAVVLSGSQLKTLKLDGAGNAKAAAALKNGDRDRKPNDPSGADRRSLIVTVTGVIHGDEVEVESLKID